MRSMRSEIDWEACIETAELVPGVEYFVLIRLSEIPMSFTAELKDIVKVLTDDEYAYAYAGDYMTYWSNGVTWVLDPHIEDCHWIYITPKAKDAQ